MILPSKPLLELFPGWTAGAIASELGTSRRAIERWKVGGGINERDADRFAVATGRTPFEVWPELLERALRRCHTCEVVLTGRADQKFCSVSCRDRDPKKRAKKAAAARRRRQNESPEARERRLAAARRYKAEARRSVRLAQLAYYRRNREKALAYAADQRRRKREAA